MFNWLKNKKRETISEPLARPISSDGIPMVEFEERPTFHFANVKAYFENHDYDDLVKAIENGEETLGQIKILKANYGVTLLFPDGTATEFVDLNTMEDRSIDTIEYFLSPAGWNEDDNDVEVEYFVLANYKFEESEEPVKSVSFGGETDFYEKFGWWPHIEIKFADEESSKLVPLSFFGEAIFKGRRGYFFDGASMISKSWLDEDEKYHFLNADILNLPADYEQYEYELHVLFILEDEDNTPNWVQKNEIIEDVTGYYFIGDEYVENMDIRIVPKGYDYPKLAKGCQDFYILDEPFNNFFIQIPALFHGIRDLGDGLYEPDEGDAGTYTFCYNENLEFRATYQQT